MEENFTPQESLQLIQSMITSTKANLGDNRFYFLLWGWVTFLAILGQFFLKVVLHYERHYTVWLLIIPAIIASVVYSKRHHSRQPVRTYVGASMSYLWTGIGISFFVLSMIISFSKEGWQHSYPFFILFYGLGTFVSGRILQFTPLVIGGVLNWALAIVCIFVSFDYQLLVTATAILCSYIIPGYLLHPNQKRYGRKATI